MLYRPGKSLKRLSKSSSLHSKRNVVVGECGFFVSDVISGGLCRHINPVTHQSFNIKVCLSYSNEYLANDKNSTLFSHGELEII